MEEERKWCVYCHTNKINGKKYIGITSTRVNKRWGKDGNGYRNNNQIPFKNAIEKYGWNSFNHEILFENLTKNEACEKEIELIKKYNTTNNKFGYNISFGGTAPMYKRKHSKETIEKFSNRKGENNSFYGKHHTLESKRKESYPVMLLNTMTRFESVFEANKFNNSTNIDGCVKELYNSCGVDESGNPRYWCKIKDGKDYEKELERRKSKNKIRNYNERKLDLKKISSSPYKERLVICLNDLKIYSYDELLNIYKNTSKISECCNNKRKSYKGKIWMYHNEYIKYTEEEITEIIDYKKLDCQVNDVIICVNTKEKFYNILSCAKYGGLKYSDGVSDCLNKTNKYAGRHPITNEPLIWLYKKEYEKLTEEELLKLLNQEIERKIICTTNGKIFNSIHEASIFYNILRTGISACCRKIYQTSGLDKNGNKLSWMYYDEYLQQKISLTNKLNCSIIQ